MDSAGLSHVHSLELGEYGIQGWVRTRSRSAQAEDSRNQLIDSVTLEVKDDYLNMQVAEKNIKCCGEGH